MASFLCRFQILPSLCRRELIFQGGMKLCRFQIPMAFCKNALSSPGEGGRGRVHNF